MDFDVLAAQLMRALRGKRSQTAFSRRLGYSTNVAYAWEAKRRAPTAAEMLRAAARTGVDVRAAVGAFMYRSLDADPNVSPTSPEFVAALLRALRGATPMRVIAERVGLSGSAISRFIGGVTEPRLPMFLRLVEATSRRLVDLLARLTDVSRLDAARDEWTRLEAMRRLAYDNPLAESVPRCLELEQYASLPRHRSGWIAERLGITLPEETRTLEDLARADVIRWDGARWQLERSRSVDTTRFDPSAARNLRAHWSDAAGGRIRAGRDGQFSYLVFTTDDATLAAIRELHLAYYRDLRALVARSAKSLRVAVANVQLFALDGDLPSASRVRAT
jgi:transcriptional regulator with XRE-family HTH domain